MESGLENQIDKFLEKFSESAANIENDFIFANHGLIRNNMEAEDLELSGKHFSYT
jgi:hypothetical protein